MNFLEPPVKRKFLKAISSLDFSFLKGKEDFKTFKTK